MVVYAEYVFLENFVMNFIILSLTAKFGKFETKKYKLVLSSAISALYAFVIFIPSLYFLFSIIMKIACSAIIIIIAFTPYKFRTFIRQLGIFYLIAIIFGGTGFAIFYFFNFNGVISNGIFYLSGFSLKNLLIAGGVAYLLIYFCWDYIQKQVFKEKIYMDLKIQIKENSVECKGMVDTGNSLIDPISKYPVIIVEYDAITGILPQEVKNFFKVSKPPSFEQIILHLENTDWITRFRMIPYKALGTDNGMLIGFKPDNVLVQKESDVRNIKEIIIAVYHSKLSKTGEYKALLHPDLI